MIEVRPSDFAVEIEGVAVTGEPDLLIERADGGWSVLDIRPGRFDSSASGPLESHLAQIRVHAAIAESAGIAPVASLDLAYIEAPPPASRDALALRNLTPRGFALPFAATLVRVAPDPSQVRALSRTARKLFSLESMPEGRSGCDNCRAVAELIGAWSTASRHEATGTPILS